MLIIPCYLPLLHFRFPTSTTGVEPWRWKAASQTSDLIGMEIERKDLSQLLLLKV